ncbi:MULTISPECIES: EutN/CcmL family microcompartment protein [Clostridium]|mgnify:FL=1|uniref:Ethanolamine utilization protein EutN n=1 Tax=Clostridium cadaveris TaxID=1529 RepID=A0A1I2K073_9CLOT|nr:EutN/CcmL family microcompartment protein [Clostridium cadaveris]MDU4952168.1 EutN/CcmL family microcompartment protein [Clostridium sp.]MDM8310460.1 EutN/CcmL family microcompartment protein [Clostridium cadaveris]MDY4950741.1 EutN/CcmL family microcompartment protein [Clostridium cadaveris]NME64621.1 EutN/CcmL family microcompartment protein [Clostridium cadaveris]NWK10718.1 EutN/CcmL family microcompartment protein [Clostridium cadaveris]
MQIGRVVGNVWATRKDEKLNGQKFLIVKILISKDKEKEGLFVAADNAGAGIGDTVLITNGSAARQSIGNKEIPIDATIVGIVDSIDIE